MNRSYKKTLSEWRNNLLRFLFDSSLRGCLYTSVSEKSSNPLIKVRWILVYSNIMSSLGRYIFPMLLKTGIRETSGGSEGEAICHYTSSKARCNTHSLTACHYVLFQFINQHNELLRNMKSVPQWVTLFRECQKISLWMVEVKNERYKKRLSFRKTYHYFFFLICSQFETGKELYFHRSELWNLRGSRCLWAVCVCFRETLFNSLLMRVVVGIRVTGEKWKRMICH